MSSTQHKLSKARPPRVQITYDVEIGDAQKAMELPLVVGVIGDFAQTEQPFRERKFISVDKDNFNDIMSAMNPNAEFMVDNKLSGHEGKIAVSLSFNNMEDFSPDNIALQIEPLRKLIEMREQLSDLRNRAASNERLKEQLAIILQLPDLNMEQEGDKDEH
jgi:type VI secretion system protein ImpB